MSAEKNPALMVILIARMSVDGSSEKAGKNDPSLVVRICPNTEQAGIVKRMPSSPPKMDKVSDSPNIRKAR